MNRLDTHLKIKIKVKKLHVRQPGIEPGSIAWKATMLTMVYFTLVLRTP